MRLKKFPVLLAVFFCVIFSALMWKFFHLNMKQSIFSTNQEKQLIIRDGVNLINYKNRHKDLDEYLNELEERYQSINKALPENLNQGAFITFLQQTAITNQVKIISIKPGTVKTNSGDSNDNNNDNTNNTDEEVIDSQNGNGNDVDSHINIKAIDNLSMLPIDFVFECDYIALINFLKAIEDSERMVNIKNLSITSKDDGEKLNCALNIIIFALDKQK